MKSTSWSRWLYPVLLFSLVWLLAACAGSRTASAPGVGQRSVENLDARAVAQRKPPTPTATLINTPKPGPTPTATPKPLAQANPQQAKQWVADGQARFVHSDLVGAEGAFIKAMAADPQNVQAYLGLTTVYLYLPQYWQQALNTAQAAVKIAPDNALVLAHLAWAQQGAQNYAEAQKNAEQAAKLAPTDATVQAVLADVLSSVYQMDDAYAAAQKAVQLDARSAIAWSTLGSLAYTLEYWDAAGRAYDKAAELEPDFFAWHLLQARHALNTTGDVEAARALLQPALKTQPNHPWVLSFLVDAALEKNDWQTAQANCQKLMAIHQPHTPFPDGYSCMASVLVVQERYKDAEPYQTLAEKLAPPARYDITLLRMRLYNENEECDKAHDLAQQWLDERPYSVIAVRMLGVSDLCAEDYTQAIAEFKQVIAKLPRSVADARLLANAYARAGRAADARAALNKVRPFAAQDPLYYQGLYEVDLFLGQHEDAISAAQQWQELRPNSVDAKVSAALAQLLAGQIAAAQSSAQSALDSGATGATVYAVLGETYSHQGDFEKAEQYLLQSLAITDKNFLAHNFILSLYLLHGDCDKAAAHVQWLAENSKNSQTNSQLQDLVEACRQRQALAAPDAKTPLSDDAAIAQVQTILQQAGAAARSIRFTVNNGQRSLLVAYTVAADPKSAEFTTLEHKIILALARLLPRIVNQPDGLILLSGANEVPQTVTFVATRAAILWSNGQLTNAEFEKTWIRRSAEQLRNGGNDM